MNAALRPAAVLLALGLVLEARADDVGKRPLPDYKGRGDAPTTAGDVLIWVPRIALAPVYLVSEYVVRRPMKWAVINTEKTRWPFRLLDFLFDRPIGLVPTVLIDFGLRPTFGLYFFWNGLVVPEDDLRVTASGGPDVVTSTLADRLTLDGGVWRVTLRGHASSRSDNVFYGLGPEIASAATAAAGTPRSRIASPAVPSRCPPGSPPAATAGPSAGRAWSSTAVPRRPPPARR